MTNTVFAPISTQSILHGGVVAVGAKAYFYDASTTTPRAIWTNSGASIAATNPVIADGDGVIPPTWVSGTGDYRIVIYTSANVLIRSIEGLKGAAPETTAVVGASTYSLTTGDTKWNFDAAELSGFVKLNGLDIGNLASGAHYSDDNLLALFSYVWDKLSNALAPVSGGRGASAAADFTASKRLSLPDMRFRFPIGSSTMGTSAAAIASLWPTATAPGTPIGNPSGTLITANLPSHTHTGTTGVGSGTIAGNTSADGAHVHTGGTTDTSATHTHDYNAPTSVPVLAGTTFVSQYASTSSATTTASGAHSHAVTVPNTSSTHSHAVSLDPATHTHGGFTTAATGSGTAFDLLNPGIVVTFYMKT
jgi:hypothetical protein